MGLSLCLSVKSHLTYGASVRPQNAVTYSAGNEGQKGFSVSSENAPLLRSSGAAYIKVAIFLHSKSGAHAYWYSQLCLQNRSLPNDCQQHSALPKTMPLALAGARTDSTTRYSYNARRGQFPRTRIGISSQDSTRAMHAVVCAEGFALQCFSLDNCLTSYYHCILSLLY